MGLSERRKIEELKTNVFPGRVNDIEEICGSPVPYEVDWDSFADDEGALGYLDNIACHRINMALRVICRDNLGKEAVRAGLKLIKLKNVRDKPTMTLSFSDGVLEMRYAFALGTSGMLGDGDIRDALENGLS
jgi:hypothetical protein